jgi:hypothetical protein
MPLLDEVRDLIRTLHYSYRTEALRRRMDSKPLPTGFIST